MEGCTEVGGETLQDEARLLQFQQLVLDPAVRPEGNAGSMEARRDARGRVDRALQRRRSVGSAPLLQPFPQQLADPGHAGYGLQ